MRNVLITFEEVMFHAPTKHTLDPRMIESSIIPAEERFIREELGDALYQDMIDTKNIVITNANKATYQAYMPAGVTLQNDDIVNGFELMSLDYQKLWKQHLWKLVSECVLVSAYPEGFIQFGNEGAFHNSPPAGLMVTSGNVVPLLTSMKWAIDKKVLDRISPLLNSMKKYICSNISSYGKYDIMRCPNNCTPDTATKNAGIALDIYEDDVVKRCCDSPGWLNG